MKKITLACPKCGQAGRVVTTSTSRRCYACGLVETDQTKWAQWEKPAAAAKGV